MVSIPGGAAAKKPDPRLEDALEEAGGAARFKRVESVDWTFLLVRATEGGAERWRGRARMKRTAGGWTVREDLESDGASLAVFFGSGPVSAFSPVGPLAEAPPVAREAPWRAFWILAPQALSDAAASTAYEGSGFFHDRLTRRLRLRFRAPPDGFPGDGAFAYLDAGDGRLRGVGPVGGTPPEAGSVLLDGHRVWQNLVSLPTLWTRYNQDAEPDRVVRVESLVLNSYLADDVFVPGAGPPATAGGPDITGDMTP